MEKIYPIPIFRVTKYYRVKHRTHWKYIHSFVVHMFDNFEKIGFEFGYYQFFNPNKYWCKVK